MAGVEEEIINSHYTILIIISIMFTMLAIYRRTVLADMLAWVLWFITGAVHLLASPTTTPLYSLSLLWWGFGLIFFVIMWADLFNLFSFKKKTSGVGPI